MINSNMDVLKQACCNTCDRGILINSNMDVLKLNMEEENVEVFDRLIVTWMY